MKNEKIEIIISHKDFSHLNNCNLQIQKIQKKKVKDIRMLIYMIDYNLINKNKSLKTIQIKIIQK